MIGSWILGCFFAGLLGCQSGKMRMCKRYCNCNISSLIQFATTCISQNLAQLAGSAMPAVVALVVGWQHPPCQPAVESEPALFAKSKHVPCDKEYLTSQQNRNHKIWKISSWRCSKIVIEWGYWYRLVAIHYCSSCRCRDKLFEDIWMCVSVCSPLKKRFCK